MRGEGQCDTCAKDTNRPDVLLHFYGSYIYGSVIVATERGASRLEQASWALQLQ